MSSQDIQLLFTPPNAKNPSTARKLHLRRLYDALELLIQRQDYARARRAWVILVRCKEIDWKAMWRIGALLLEEPSKGRSTRKLDYISSMLLQYPDEKESILKELVLHYIASGKHRTALDELELYLPSPPYESNPILHVYAGLIHIYLAQPGNHQGTWSIVSLREGQKYLEKAKMLDAENIVALAWLEKIPTFSTSDQAEMASVGDSDEEVVNDTADDTSRSSKRIRKHI